MANINHIKFSNFRQAIVKDKYYSDLFTIEKCDFWIQGNRYNEEYMISITYNGDGLLINQLHFSTGDFSEEGSELRNCIYINNNGGGKISNIINGNIKITNSSELSIENYHSESGIFEIDNSNISLKNCSFLNTKNKNFITIGANSSAYHGNSSIVNLENVCFSFMNENRFRPTKQLFDINIMDNSTVKINNCYRRCGNSYLGIYMGREGYPLNSFNSLSSKASLNCVLIADKVMNAYHFNTFGGSQSKYFNLELNPYINWESANGTYYYRFMLVMDNERKLGTVSDEVSINTTGKAINLKRGTYNITGCMIRIFRGTESNSYTETVDIPILYEYNNTLTDFGNDIGGYV